MPGQRELYHSSNGDRWPLCSEDDGRVFVLHEANFASGSALSGLSHKIVQMAERVSVADSFSDVRQQP
jgi:hypothetical protein